MKFKAHIYSDKTKNSLKIRSSLEKKIKSTSINKSKLIIVIGGDGFMLQTLKKFYKFKKPFYGLNSGTYGFLMNKFKTKKFIENIAKSKPVTISALQMVVKNKNNTTKKGIAINEISMFRQSKQAATIQIKKGKKIIMK